MWTVALQAAVIICMIDNAYHRLSNMRLYTLENCLVQHFARSSSDHPKFLWEPMDQQCLALKHAAKAQQKEAKHELESQW